MLLLVALFAILFSPCFTSDPHDSTLTATLCRENMDSYFQCGWAKSVDTVDFNSISEASAYTNCVLQFVQFLYIYDLTDDVRNTTLKHIPLDDAFLEPPGVWGKYAEPVNISIQHSYIDGIYEEESDHKMHVHATYTLKWTDRRLVWDEATCLPTKQISFTEADLLNSSIAHLWRPDFHSIEHSDIRWNSLRVNGNTGEVIGQVAVNGAMRCTTAYRKYPFDERTCYHLVFPQSMFVQFEPESRDGFANDIGGINHIVIPPGWSLEKLVETKLGKPSGRYVTHPHAMLVFTFKRTSLLAFKVSGMLLAVSVTLGIFGPLTGTLNGLKMTKSVSIASAMVGVAIFALHNERLYQGAEIPQILTVFEFSVAVTLLSLLLSLIHYQFANQFEVTTLPLPHKVNLIAGLINKVTWWIPRLSTRRSEQIVKLIEKPNDPEWQEVNDAVHRCSVLIFSLIYIIGTAVAVNL